MSSSIVSVLPTELLLKIGATVPIEDYLSLKLTCKTFSECMPRNPMDFLREEWHELPLSITALQYPQEIVWQESLKTIEATAKLASIHARLEWFMHSSQSAIPPNSRFILCVRCAKIKPWRSFSSKQARHVFLPRITGSRAMLEGHTSVLGSIGGGSPKQQTLLEGFRRDCIGCTEGKRWRGK